MHFTRGYIYLFLLIVTAKGVEIALERHPHFRKRRFATWLAFGLVPLMLIDNVLFVARVGMETPREGLLTISREAKQVLDYFRSQPGSLGVLSVNDPLGVLIVAHTRHRLLQSERAITPFYGEREWERQKLIRSRDVDLAHLLGIDRAILVNIEGVGRPPWASNPACFRVLLDNGLYQVGEFLGAAGGP